MNSACSTISVCPSVCIHLLSAHPPLSVRLCAHITAQISHFCLSVCVRTSLLCSATSVCLSVCVHTSPLCPASSVCPFVCTHLCAVLLHFSSSYYPEKKTIKKGLTEFKTPEIFCGLWTMSLFKPSRIKPSLYCLEAILAVFGSHGICYHLGVQNLSLNPTPMSPKQWKGLLDN